MTYIIEKCRAYHDWGFPAIYVVDPDSRLVFCWTGRALQISDNLTEIPSAQIWERLDSTLKRQRK